MANIYNGDLKRELIAGAGIQTSVDVVPNQIADKVVPVMEVNPKMLRTCDIIKRAIATNATSATIYTTPANADFYLIGANMCMIKDATSTSAETSIKATKDNASINILEFAGITLTAQTLSESISLNNPLKLDRNTTITITNATNTANIRSSGIIYGYIVDNPNN